MFCHVTISFNRKEKELTKTNNTKKKQDVCKTKRTIDISRFYIYVFRIYNKKKLYFFYWDKSWMNENRSIVLWNVVYLINFFFQVVTLLIICVFFFVWYFRLAVKGCLVFILLNVFVYVWLSDELDFVFVWFEFNFYIFRLFDCV